MNTLLSFPKSLRAAPPRLPAPRSRRAFLTGGSAVALGLPFLESMFGRAEARAAACDAPRRWVTYYVPNGCEMGAWAIPAAATTATFTLSPTLTALQSIRADTLIIQGLHNKPGIPFPVGGSHGTGAAGLLTCQEWKRTAGKVGTSADQIAADALGACTPANPSLQLGVERHDPYDELGVPSVAHGTLSWKNSQPLPKITDPNQAFARLFKGTDAAQSIAEANQRKARKVSILDLVLEEQKTLALGLGSTDQQKLNEYFTSVRALEQRVQATKPVTCGDSALNAPATGDYRTNLAALHEIMALAFQCDATRVITFMAGDSLRTFGMPWVNVGDPHGITHSGDLQGVRRVDKWRLEQFVLFIKRLASILDPNGKSVLYNSAVCYCSEVSDGGRHSNENRPTLVCGQLGGTITTGRLLMAGKPVSGDGRDGTWDACDEGRQGCANQQPVANLYLALLNGLGVPAKTFPGSTGTLSLA